MYWHNVARDIADGQPDSFVQDIENMVRAFIEKVIILVYNKMMNLCVPVTHALKAPILLRFVTLSVKPANQLSTTTA